MVIETNLIHLIGLRIRLHFHNIYYMTNHDYATARDCLICADKMLEYAQLNDDAKLIERQASFKRCWVKYAINLLGKVD